MTGRDSISVSKGNGIIVKTPSFSISLDPKSASNCEYTFVSHAHIDHVHTPNGKSKIIASKETKELAKARGYDLGKTVEESEGIELFDSGHILGSRAILVEDQVFYTGDVAIRDRAFLKGLKGVKCETLIIETTYGRPHYVFPDLETIERQVNRFISSCFDSCRPVVLTGYPLGKAQLLTYIFDKWEPVYLHDSICKMNSCYIDLGVGLRKFEQFNSSEEFQKKLSKGPWILIAPNLGGKSSFVSSLKQKYDVVLASFSGWAVDSRYKFVTGSDCTFPLSDHCDYSELVRFVKTSDPQSVYTFHGFADEFASHLRDMGFEAESIDEPQVRLTTFSH